MGDAGRRRRPATEPPDPGGSTTRDATRWRPGWSDVALAVFVAALSSYSFTHRTLLLFDSADGLVRAASPDLLGMVQVLAGSLVLAWRRSAPGTVLAVTVLLTLSMDAENYPVVPLPYFTLVAMYTVAQRWPLRGSAVALLLTSLGMGFGAVMLLYPVLDDEPMVEVVAVATAWALGRGVRSRQVSSRLLEERAALLEESARQQFHEQAALSELAVARERASIARELHDVVASNVSVIVAQAGAARCRSGDGAAAANRDSLATIESLGRQTLGDMRELVGVLHSAPEDSMMPRALPTLDELGHLVDRVASADGQVTLTVTGPRHELPAVVELHAYRIVQESLTNVLKHAHGAAVRVQLDYEPAHLHIRVTDTGAGPAPGSAPAPGPGGGSAPRSAGGSAGGSGLFGMRQRASLVGGTLSAGPTSDGGWVVEARIPIGRGDLTQGGG